MTAAEVTGRKNMDMDSSGTVSCSRFGDSLQSALVECSNEALRCGQTLAYTADIVMMRQLASGTRIESKAEKSRLAMPGFFPGRVVAILHPGSLFENGFQAEPIKGMVESGMLSLTEAPDLTSAWSLFFERGDVVGIKVNLVGGPHLETCSELLHEIVMGLESAGVHRKDVVVFDRFHAQFLKRAFQQSLPEGVRWSFASERFDRVQQAIEGYDPEHFMQMDLVLPGQDPCGLTPRRSYAAKFITKEVNKLINLPLLKDHQSAGVSLALKNLSHGLMNNVHRSHSSRTVNVCGIFIPAAVSLPIIRNKAVLHILDGLKGLFHGGPTSHPQFVWPHQTLYFATDPVALDRVCRAEIDKRRVAVGLNVVAEAEPDEFSVFVRRQPEHVEVAGAVGLGVWQESATEVRSVTLGV